MSSLPPKRSIDEIAIKYRLSPDFGRDVYVEGVRDKNILEWYLRERRVEDAAVFTINTVDIGDGIVLAKGLNAGSNRSRVIALRAELAERGVSLDRHLFIIDRDQEDLAPTPLAEGLCVSDLGSLSTLLINSDALSRLIGLVGQGRVTLEVFSNSILEVCSELYFIRASAKRLGLPLRILPIDDFLSIEGNVFFFDSERYLNRCINGSNLFASASRLVDELLQCRILAREKQLSGWVLVNDHDLVRVVRRLMRLCGDGPNRSENDIRDLLLMAADVNLLAQHRLFQLLG